MYTRASKLLLVTVALFMAAANGCVPDVDESDTLVSEPRVLAIRALPAEAAIRDTVKLTALYADATGGLKEGPIDWAFCVQRKSLAELGPVSPECLTAEGDALLPLGEGLTASGDVPEDACRLFGPESPAADEDEPAGRPVDPDTTGGYYQPVRVLDADTQRYAIYESRLQCGLPYVTPAQYADFNRRYRFNINPEVAALEITRGADSQELTPIAKDVEPITVKAGKPITLRVSWNDCSDGAECGDGICGENETDTECREDCRPIKGCTGSEHYLYFDPIARELQTRREAMRVSWFSTAGKFEDARTGRAEAEAKKPSSDNVWTAPTTEQDLTLWVVLRDDRGGTAWRAYALHVER